MPTSLPYEVITDLSYVPSDDPNRSISIYLPKQTSQKPLTLLVEAGDYFPDMLRYFAESGYPVIAFNTRRDTYQAELHDGFCALAWAHTNADTYGYNAAGIVLVGGSMMGGNTAILGLVDDPTPFLEECSYSLPETDRVRAVITLAGVFDYSEQEDFFTGFIGSIRDFMGGTSEQVPENWAAASAINWVREDAPPFLIIHGEADSNIAPHQSEKFAAALEEAGTDVELVLLAGVNHSTSVTDRRVFEVMASYLARLEEADRWRQAIRSVHAVISADTADRVVHLYSLNGHSDRVIDMAFSGDGTYLASSSRDQTILLWNVANGKAVHTFSMDKVSFNGIAFSPDGSMLASADAIWDVENGQLIHALEQGRLVPGPVAFSPDGLMLAAALEGQPIRLWDTASGLVVRTFNRPVDEVTFSITFSPDGRLLAAGVHGGIVRLWEVANGEIAGAFDHGNEESDIHEVAFSPNGRILASGSTDTTARLWDVASGQVVHTLVHWDGLYGLAFSPDGSLLATANCDRTVKLWDVTSGRLLQTLNHADEVMTVAFSPDGRLLASGGYDHLIYLWGVTR